MIGRMSINTRLGVQWRENDLLGPRERIVQGHTAGILEGTLKRWLGGESLERHVRGGVRVHEGSKAYKGREALKQHCRVPEI